MKDEDPLIPFQKWTQARIGLKRSGHSISTRQCLDFRLAHAAARDAVHSQWDYLQTQSQLNDLQQESLCVASQVRNRDEFLKRPDLGKILSQDSVNLLRQQPSKNSREPFDAVFIVSDGLSATAVEKHFLPFWQTLKNIIEDLNLDIAPLVLAPLTRVAISDEIGFHLNAKVSIIIIGERPGLSSTDSMGIYLTYRPQPENQDSGRNCISNIRPPQGLSYECAAQELCLLLSSSLKLQLSGIGLKPGAFLSP